MTDDNPTSSPAETISESPVQQPSDSVSETRGKPGRKGWSWTVINFWLDAVLGLTFLLLMYISCVLQFVFPVGAEAVGWTLWGGDFVAWQNFQFGTLCTFGALVVLHVMFHWTWVCSVINRQILGRTLIRMDGSETLIGVITIAALLHLLALGVLIARWCVAH